MYVCCNGEGRREEREGACGWLSNFAAWHIQSASSFLTCWPFCRWPFCCGPVVGSVYLGAFCFLPLPPLRLFVQTEICKFVKHFLMCLILFQFFSFSCSIFVSVCKGCVCVCVYRDIVRDMDMCCWWNFVVVLVYHKRLYWSAGVNTANSKSNNNTSNTVSFSVSQH